jgi:sugar phosphate isomerase/epimerase
MNACVISRRTFVKAGAAAATTAAVSIWEASAAGVLWPIGCFNRPWMQKFGQPPQPVTVPQPANWGLDVALKGMRQAGYSVAGLLTNMPGEPFVGPDATDFYLVALKQRLAAAGMTATMGSLRLDFSLSLPEAIQQVRRQIEHAQVLNLEWLLTFGADHEEDYEKYYQMMSDAADYAQERNIKLVLKPHGGGSGASEEILRCLKQVNRPNFKIWYDAGNILYYTGKDPVEELKPIAGHVTGVCAKDCTKAKGDVMIQLGAGKVDFLAVYTELKKAGFHGPTFVECAGGATFQEVTDGARANRIFLERIFAAL